MDRLEEIRQRLDAAKVFPHFSTRTEIKIHAEDDLIYLLAEIERLREQLQNAMREIIRLGKLVRTEAKEDK